MSVWMHARLAGLIEGAETMDYLARRDEAALDGARPEFGDLQRDWDEAMGAEGSAVGDGSVGVPMEPRRGMSEAGRRALMEEMKVRGGL